MGGSKGKVASMVAQSKADRRNHQQQKREAKRQELMRKKRGLDGLPAPPRVVGIISVGANQEIEDRIRSFITQGADRVSRPHSYYEDATVSCKFDVHKKDGHLTLLTARSAFAHYGEGGDDAAMMAALDLARVCDVLLFVIDGNGPKIDESGTMEIQFGGDEGTSVSTSKSSSARQDWDHLISERGDRILTAIKGQGLPTPVTVLAHTEKEALEADHVTMQSVKSLRRSSVKRRLELKKYVGRFATTEFGSGNDKVIDVDLSSMDDDDMDEDAELAQKSAAAGLVRTLCSMSCSPARWVSKSPRAYILSDTHQYDETTKELSLAGYVRGIVPFDVNSLVHLPNIGTFACKELRKTQSPLVRRGQNVEMDLNDHILTSDPEKQESLEIFATPDALEGEQNLIGFDEEAFDSEQEKEGKFARPAGWSDYQSAWLDAVDADAFEDAADRGELAEELNKKKSSHSDGMSMATDAMELDDATNVSAEERRALIEQRRKEQTENREFPDEVQVDEEENARDRFARYRSLKSFRKSYWDPKENLPDSYASIYSFASFKATQRSVMNDMNDIVRAAERARGQFFGWSHKKDTANVAMEGSGSEEEDDLLEGCIPTGSYITLTIANVPKDSVNNISFHALITAVSLLPHENKVSVLHMGLSQPAGCDVSEDVPVKSKDVLRFRCGWRTWTARPVFSQHNLNCDKHKFERYLPQGGAYFAASVFGPVTYTPCPVLVFRKGEGCRRSELIAIGSMIGADADRVVVKRIILTGYPVRVHKRHATVKYMFYNPEDVKWFKPAGLYTKHGLEGHIVESVGEHGTMKCLFNAPIKQHDTVCLPLYKRIYPKLAPMENDDTQDEKTYQERACLVVR